MHIHTTSRAAAALLVLLVSSCGDGEDGGTGQPPADPYVYTPPPPGPAPSGLDPATWTAHLADDLVPYWSMAEAKGTTAGNFPTWRTMTGATTANGARKPRMLGRQTYAYAIEFMMTGDEASLDLARAGTRFILDHAWDSTAGGWHADLDADGNASGAGDKYAQDFSYTVMGPAAYFYVTRDPEAEQAVLDTRDLLFDPTTYWDEANQRIRDGRTADLSAEVPMADAGWELVSQLDPVTAFMLLVQPVLSEPDRSAELLGDLRTLGTTMRDHFWQGGYFWGTTAKLGQFGTRHADFGHGLKAYWALTQIDKRLDDRPFAAFLAEAASPNVTQAYDTPNGRWAKRPTSATSVEYGSDWWIYAEADQFAATLALHDPTWLPVVAATAAHWRSDYVDGARPAREVFSSIRRNGTGYGWADGDISKCNDWKSAFHSHEHALVMFLLGHYLAGTPAPLYFAFPAAELDARAAASTPYTFQGKVAGWEDLGAIEGTGLHKVRITFEELR